MDSPSTSAFSSPASTPTTATSSDAYISDVYSLTDKQLSERLEFREEIGFGNWGSVWACRPRMEDEYGNRRKLAVKLVHRSKTSTSAARVRSLWNEMKVVRSFKDEHHPAIIPFHSFIITPSYALITMDYLPRLVPVEVKETKARQWFISLLGAITFLHSKGVVHNDIKPANVLLSRSEAPILVDFGFAETYPSSACSGDPFVSTLSYGTPEYLSPERARGQPHDTRKSDIWSLGITFFEILVGRTPFEKEEGEEFCSKEDLERYWQRTVKGQWMGEWKMSQEIERLLRKMINPNADLRITATQASRDPYFSPSFILPSPQAEALSSPLSVKSPSQSTAKAKLLAIQQKQGLLNKTVLSPKSPAPTTKSQLQKENSYIPSHIQLAQPKKVRKPVPSMVPEASTSGSNDKEKKGHRTTRALAELGGNVGGKKKDISAPPTRVKEAKDKAGSPTVLKPKVKDRLPSVGLSMIKESFKSSGKMSKGVKEEKAWGEEVERMAKSSLPSVKQALQNERLAAENRLDRMTMWIRSVERVVEDARVNFQNGGSGAPAKVPLPPRMTSKHRPRTSESAAVVIKDSPSSRRATIGYDLKAPLMEDMKQKEKEVESEVKEFTLRPISPLVQLEREMQTMHNESVRLSAIIDTSDRSLFFSKPNSPIEVEPTERSIPMITLTDLTIEPKTPQKDGSPLKSHWSPDTKSSPSTPNPTPATSTTCVALADDPTNKDVEGVYDRFLMATSGVVRLGRGYQSDNTIHDTSLTQQQVGQFDPRRMSQSQTWKRNSLFNSIKGKEAHVHYAADDIGLKKAIANANSSKDGPGNESGRGKTMTNSMTLRMRKALMAIVSSTPGSAGSKTVKA